ncbi:hypothetical protein [Empedobacter brevis]|uniref:hypothetical protein n=1 Tax=Empedobacter brevis TaxID=247 RepID=UPI0028AC2D3B|nr:hypothetical protein [Empedobacter brevis]
MKNNDKISNYIKNDLENRELKPSHDAWDRIQARMDVTPIARKSNFKWWLSVAVVALFTISTSVYFYINQTETENNQEELVNHKEQSKATGIEMNTNSNLTSSESVLADNETIDSSKEEVEIPIKEEKKAIQKGKVQIAINEESQQVEISLPIKKEILPEKKDELKTELQQKKNLVANIAQDSIKKNKKKKYFVDPNMLLYSIENKENLKESNQSRVVSIGFK